MDCSPPGFSFHGILQARVLEWVGMPSSRGSSRPRDRTRFSYLSFTGRRVLYHSRHLGSPRYTRHRLLRAHNRCSPKAISALLSYKRGRGEEHRKGALQGTAQVFATVVTSLLIVIIRHLLFFRGCDGPSVTVAMETQCAVPDWTVRGLLLEAALQAYGGPRGGLWRRERGELGVVGRRRWPPRSDARRES